MAKSIMVERI